jgi:hypothetical protein
MKKATRVKIYFVLLWIFLIISFSMVAIFILYEANGYRLNRNTWRLELAGLISIDGLPKSATIKINNKIVAKALPFKIAKALPGTYLLSVSRDGYSTWSKTIEVTAGQAYQDKYVYLYLAAPQIQPTSRNITSDQIKSDAQNELSSLQIINDEIWYQKKLVTRFSSVPSGAILTDDKDHIIFQLGQELRVMDLDSSNNIKLFSLPSADPTVFALYSDKIIFASQDKIFEVKIR